MGYVTISKVALLAGVLAVGFTLSGVALASSASGVDGATSLRAGVGQAGCLGEPETWLPGTLQIEAPGAAPDRVGEMLRARPDEDCVLA